MFFYNLIKSIFDMLHSEISPNEIAFGAALGAFIGFSPYMTPQNVLIFLLIFLLKVNVGAATLSAGLFAILAQFLDPLFDKIGYSLLVKAGSLTPFWTKLYNMPIIPFTKFYNTVVLGSFLSAIAFFIPVYIFSKWFIVYYRTNLQVKVQNWKIWKIFKLDKLVNIYNKYQQ